MDKATVEAESHMEDEDRALQTVGTQSAFLSMLNMGIITPFHIILERMG